MATWFEYWTNASINNKTQILSYEDRDVHDTVLVCCRIQILGIFVIYMFITKVEDRYRLFKYRKRYYPN